MSEARQVSVQRLHPVQRCFFSEAVLKIAWNPSGKLVAVLTADGMLYLTSPTSIESHLSVLAHESGALSLAWAADGVNLATTGQDGTIKIWRSSDLQLVVSHQLGGQWVERVVWDLEGGFATAMGKRLFVAKDIGEQSVRQVAEYETTITGIAWRNDRELVITTNGKASRLGVAADSSAEIGYFAYPDAMLELALSPDGSSAAIGCQGSSVRVWTLDRDNDAVEMSGYREKVTVLAWDQRSEHLAVASGGSINVWSFLGAGPHGTIPRELVGPGGVISTANFAPSGKRLLAADRSGVICIWDLSMDSEVPLAAGINKSAVYAAEWNRTVEYILSGDKDGSIALWRVSR